MYVHLRSNTVFDLPFALSIGPQRAGTSWIDRYLRARGDICMPNGVKELFFFDRQYERGLDFYKIHFTPAENQKLAMEITTTSFDCPDAPARIFENFGGNIRLLCPLRHPVARSYSLYHHYKRYGIVDGDLQSACAAMPQILTSSHYAAHLERWLSLFGPGKIHFLYQEHMDADLNGFVAELCNALQIPCILPSAEIRSRYNAYGQPPVRALARAAQGGGAFLRQYRLYGIINIAKKIGLKKLAFGAEKSGSDSLISPADRAFLEDRLAGQVESLEKLIGAIPYWQSKDALQQTA